MGYLNINGVPPNQKVNKGEEVTYLSINIAWSKHGRD